MLNRVRVPVPRGTRINITGTPRVWLLLSCGRLKSPSSSSSAPDVLRHLKAQDPANSSQPSPHPLMTLRYSSRHFLIPSFTMVHLKTLNKSSIPTTILPKFAGLLLKASLTSLTCAGLQTFRHRSENQGARSYLARVIGSLRTNSWAIPTAHSQGESFPIYRSTTDSITSHHPSCRKFYIPHHRHSLR